MKISINRKELLSSGLMLLIGIGTVIVSLDYDVGSLSLMGPGYFPLLLGLLLIMVSMIMIATSSVDIEEDLNRYGGKPQYRAWAYVVLGMVLFILLGQYGGLVPATFALVFVSALGDRSNSVKAAILLGLAVSILAVAIFHYGLRMQFPLFAWG